MDVKKYSPYCANDGERYRVGMALDGGGNYVLATDYNKLNDEVTELTMMLANEREVANERITELESAIEMMVERM